MEHSYTGSILHVNLSTGCLTIETPPDAFYRKYGGGSAMGMYYILKQMPKSADPLGPNNVLTMFTGVTTGLPVSGQARLCVNARSPRRGTIGDSQAGGFFPAVMKFAGFDGAVIEGKSEKPVYLYIHDGVAELRDATHLWGKVTGEAEDILKKEIGDEKIEVLQIGPAGENLVRFACILNMSCRANGRTGMGAVMGSKKLKAVVVQGRQKIGSYAPEAVKALARLGAENLASNPDLGGLSRNGTADVVAVQNMMGTLPTRNYNEGQFEKVDDINGDRLTETLLKERDTCFACVVRCKRVVDAEYKGQKIYPKYGGPEYETIATMGSYCGVNDLAAISLANQYCNMYGMDTISCGATVAFAMECFEKGLLTNQDTDGIELRFGDADAMLAMVKKIGLREGIGDVLAEGSDRAAEKIGKDSSQFLVTTKGNEAPAHMPQAKKSLSLVYAVNPFGADHQSTEHDPMIEEGTSDLCRQRLALLGLETILPPGSMAEEKVRYTYKTQVFYAALDSFSLCQFAWGPSWQLMGPAEMVEFIKAGTGWEITLDEVMKVGERRLNMMRAFNMREGFSRIDDILPAKFYRPLQGTGPSAGFSFDVEDIEQYKDEYYRFAGWDAKTGNPSQEKLNELGLDWIKM